MVARLVRCNHCSRNDDLPKRKVKKDLRSSSQVNKLPSPIHRPIQYDLRSRSTPRLKRNIQAQGTLSPNSTSKTIISKDYLTPKVFLQYKGNPLSKSKSNIMEKRSSLPKSTMSTGNKAVASCKKSTESNSSRVSAAFKKKIMNVVQNRSNISSKAKIKVDSKHTKNNMTKRSKRSEVTTLNARSSSPNVRYKVYIQRSVDSSKKSPKKNEKKTVKCQRSMPVTKPPSSNKKTSKSRRVVKEHISEAQKKEIQAEYYSQLKNLNVGVSKWIQMHVDSDPFCILTPVFKDYTKYLKEIENNNRSKFGKLIL